MEKVKKVTIKSGDTELHFNVRLFTAMQGLDFIDSVFVAAGDRSKTFSIKSVMAELLPLATLVGADGTVVDTMSIDKVDTYFQNPLLVIDLAKQIFDHQMVFMNESETFRPLIPAVRSMFNMPISDSLTQ